MDQPQKDEEILLRSYKDPRAFGALVDRYEKPFFRKCFFILRTKEDAEDAVQDAFVKIYKYGRKHAEEGKPFAPWAHAIAKNCAITLYNKRKAEGRTHEFNDEMLPNPELAYAREGYDADLVASVLGRIRKPFAMLLSLYFIEDKSCKEIAKITDQSVGNVRVRLHRARRSFREAYKEINEHE